MHRHVHLRARVIQTNGFGVVDEARIKFVFANQLEDRRSQVCVADHRFGFDRSAIDHHRLDSIGPHVNRFHVAVDSHVNAVGLHLLFHRLDQFVGSALEHEHALGHEVGENNAVGDRGILKRRPVRVGDRLHQQANHIFAAGEEFFEQLAGGE